MAADDWVPANGGTETPSTSRSGRRILYCWQRSTGQHRYIDLGSDLVLPLEYDPVYDGTTLDPCLPPKRMWVMFVPSLSPQQKVTVFFTEEQHDMSYRLWETEVKAVDGIYPIPASLQSSAPTIIASRADYGSPSTHPGSLVDTPRQALAVLSTALRAVNGESVVSPLDEHCRNLAQSLCKTLHGNSDNIWADVTLLQNKAQPSTYNW